MRGGGGGGGRLNRQPCRALGVHGGCPRLLSVSLQKFGFIFDRFCAPNLTPPPTRGTTGWAARCEEMYGKSDIAISFSFQSTVCPGERHTRARLQWSAVSSEWFWGFSEASWNTRSQPESKCVRESDRTSFHPAADWTTRRNKQ